MHMVLDHLSTLLEGCRPLDVELRKRHSGDHRCYDDGDDTHDGPILSHAVGALLSLSSMPTMPIESTESAVRRSVACVPNCFDIFFLHIPYHSVWRESDRPIENPS